MTAKLCALVVALAVITRARVAVLPGWVMPVPALTMATALILRARGRDGVADAADAPRGQPPPARPAAPAGDHHGQAVMTAAAVLAAVSAAYTAGHWAGDYWVQHEWQAVGKAAPGWPGRRACATHVATYTATLALAWWWLALPLSPAWIAAGLAVSAVTHYAADRRRPLRWLAARVGKLAHHDLGEGLATGAACLDQAWHWWWLFAAALITAGGGHV